MPAPMGAAAALASGRGWGEHLSLAGFPVAGTAAVPGVHPHPAPGGPADAVRCPGR